MNNVILWHRDDVQRKISRIRCSYYFVHAVSSFVMKMSKLASLACMVSICTNECFAISALGIIN